MRRFAFAAAVAAAAMSTPALADETRVEVRGGINWCCGTSDDSLGVALGHDFDLKDSGMFFGVEAVLDSNFNLDTPVAGVNARLGTKVGENTKVFALAGFAQDTGSNLNDVVVGAGLQHNLGERFLVSLQYQRALDTEINRALVGVGIRF